VLNTSVKNPSVSRTRRMACRIPWSSSTTATTPAGDVDTEVIFVRRAARHNAAEGQVGTCTRVQVLSSYLLTAFAGQLLRSFEA
jgi:hypothetical protein